MPSNDKKNESNCWFLMKVSNKLWKLALDSATTQTLIKTGGVVGCTKIVGDTAVKITHEIKSGK